MLYKGILGRAVGFITIAALFSCTLHNNSLRPHPSEVVVSNLHSLPSPLRWPSAHRGDRRGGPDNSINAIIFACASKIPLVEIDIRQGSDGTLFLFHDGHLNERNFIGPQSFIMRTAESLSDAELTQIKVPFTLFKDAVHNIQEYPCALQLDVKHETPELIDKIVSIVRQARQPHQIVIQCQQKYTLEYIRQTYPDIVVLARCQSPEDVNWAIEKGAEIVQIDIDWITEELVEKVHKNGLKLLVKSLGVDKDHLAQWNELFSAGIDIILTDKPSEVLCCCGQCKP